MEKSRPHYSLAETQAIVVAKGLGAFTQTAVFNGLAMGLGAAQLCGVVLSLSRGMFFKSMTTQQDHTVWQDVYHAPCPNGKTAYVKLTLMTGAVVIQFKEK